MDHQEIPGSNPGQVYLYATTCWPNGKAPDYGETFARLDNPSSVTSGVCFSDIHQWVTMEIGRASCRERV